MENDWDLKLLQEMEPDNSVMEDKEFQPDLLLQPITTQQKFNMKDKDQNKISSSKKFSDHRSKQVVSNQQPEKQISLTKDSKPLNDQSKKFRQYLSQKVEQLRKSKQFIGTQQKQPNKQNHENQKSNNLRKIINLEQIKQKQSQKHKIQSSAEKPSKQNNKPKQQKQKQTRSTNSHPSLAKNSNQNPNKKANNNLTDTKKSFNLQNSNKSPKLPNLTTTVRIPLPIKNQTLSVHDPKYPKKNTIDPSSFKQVETQKEKRKTPESKNSFRIKRTSNVQPANQIPADVRKLSKQVSMKIIQKQSPIRQSNNKKLREQFMRLNEEEKKLQQEIFKNHQNNKDFLQTTMRKYKISRQAFQKYGIKKQSQFQSEVSSQKQTKSPQKRQAKESRIQKNSQKQIKTVEQENPQTPLQKQMRKNQFIDEEIQKINNLLISKEKQIKKYEIRRQKNPLMQFIKQQPEDILEEPDEDEADIVEELPNQSRNKQDSNYEGKDFSSTYSSVMSQMKNKKWGLKQRITFETHRQSVQKRTDLKQSKTNDNFNSFNKKQSLTDHNLPIHFDTTDQSDKLNNKIQVNSRLKNLLFD